MAVADLDHLEARVRRPRFDVRERPFLVLFELTRACALACRHCRAEAMSCADPAQLTTREVEDVFADLAALGPPRPIVVLTGGDPLERQDLSELVRRGSSAGLRIALSPAGTPLASEPRLADLRAAGVTAVSFSLDGASPARHDAFRRVDGSFAWTVAACRAARRVGIRLQLNTTVSAQTVRELPRIARLAGELGAGLWSVFFVVPTGRGRSMGALSAEDTEDVLHFLYDIAELVPLKTTEAPQFRRVMLERDASGGGEPEERGALYGELRELLAAEGLGRGDSVGRREGRRSRRSPMAVGDGRGVVFVSHTGDVCPSGFLPLTVGNVRERRLSEIYAEASLLRDLRDPDCLHGRCGRCELRHFCGGSRAQAFAASGDPLGEDPTCPYEPAPPARAGGEGCARYVHEGALLS